MKPSSKISLFALAGLISCAIIGSIVQTRAVNMLWNVNEGDAWTWQVTTAVWDDTGDIVGKRGIVAISEVNNNSEFTWIKGNISIFNADGSVNYSTTGLLIGNISIDSNSITSFSIFSDAENFMFPAVLPLPISEVDTQIEDLLNNTIQELLSNYSSEIPIDISYNGITFDEGSILLNFSANGELEGYTLDNQLFQVEISYDDKGVVLSVTATAIDVYSSIDIVVFEVTQSTGGDVPGFPLYLLLGISISSIITMVVLKKRRIVTS